MPVKALSKLFRAKFRDVLRKTDYFTEVPAPVWRQDWVVHSKAVGSGLPALKYLAPYIPLATLRTSFRVAISNSRILTLENDKVTFCYQDTDTGQERVCTLAAEEFIRRFLQYVLPSGFVKVRYNGLFSPAWRKQLATLRLRLGGKSLPIPDSDDAHMQEEVDIPADAALCPKCGRVMVKRQRFRPRGRCPP